MQNEVELEKSEEEIMEESLEKPTEPPKKSPTPWYCIDHGAVIPKEVSGRMFCPICNKLVSKEPYEKKQERVGVEVPKPPEVETIEEAIAFIKERLAQVYGVGKNDRLILKALEDNPAPLRDGNLLHAFIKSMAPKVYDAHLSAFVIGPLYANFPNLPQAVDKRLAGTQPVPYAYSYQPLPPQSTGYTPAFQPTGYGPLFQPTPLYAQYPPTLPPPYLPQAWYMPKPPKTYKIVVEGQEIETDESGFMAWQRFLREKEDDKRRAQEHELTMKKLEAEIKKIAEETGRGSEPTVPVKIGDKEFQVPVSFAPFYLKGSDEASKKIDELSRRLEEEREARHKAELEMVQRDLEELKKRPGFFEELRSFQEIAPMLGFQKGGRTTADLLDSLAERLDQRAAQLLNKIPAPSGEWKPAVTRTPEERARKAEEIKQKLERSEEILQAEDELIRAAAKVKPRTGTS